MTHDDRISPAASPFRPEGVLHLADVVARVEAGLEGTARRDTLSAFRVLEARLGLDLAAIPATAHAIRPILAGLTPGNLGVSEKRIANLRSAVSRAVARFGMRQRPIASVIPLAPEWTALLARVGQKLYRCGLHRLAAYASVEGIPPEAVTPDTLRGLHAALEAECFVKDPRALVLGTITLWNGCRRRIAGWPPVHLTSPFPRREPHMLPLASFPASFRADLAAWEARMTNPDPLDPRAPTRALRPSTIRSRLQLFRQFASALVRRDVLPLEDITGLAVFFEADHFRAGLRHYLPGDTAAPPSYAHRVSVQLAAVARHYLGLPEERLAEVEAVVRRLDPKLPQGMGKRHRDRLDQFDDPEVVRRLLGFPAEELARALAKAGPTRRARGVERALAISILIHTGLRLSNLCGLRLDRSIRRTGGRVLIDLREDETKNEVALTLELPGETVEILERYLADHRHLLPGAEGPYLFPGIGGGPRCGGAMRKGVSAPLLRYAGITINPHLYRHVIAKIVVERNPEMYVAVSRRLGHRSLRTTLGSYLGTETRAASRRINRLLEATREAPDLQD